MPRARSARTKPSSPMPAKRLYADFVRAARALGAKPRVAFSESKMQHQSTDRGLRWSQALSTASFDLSLGAEVFELKIVHEKQEEGSEERVYIFSRRNQPRRPGFVFNAQTASFNSQNFVEGAGYFIRTIAKPEQQAAYQSALSHAYSAFPSWDGRSFQLGLGSAQELMERLIAVTRLVEDVKCHPVSDLPRLYPAQSSFTDYTPADLTEIDEGKSVETTSGKRTRSASLRLAARRHYAAQQPDGHLRCLACGFQTPAFATREIIELHHAEPLGAAPQAGIRLPLHEAIPRLTPLCPTCHRLIHALPGEALPTLTALQSHLKRSKSASA